MATFDITPSEAVLPEYGLTRVNAPAIRLDFSTRNYDSADLLQFFKVPADSFVVGVGYEVEKVEGGVLTVEVGDGADPNGWIAALDLNTLAADFPLAAAYAAVKGKYYATEDTLDITFNNDADLAIVILKPVLYDLRTPTNHPNVNPTA